MKFRNLRVGPRLGLGFGAILLITALLALSATSPAWAWSNHALASYRAFEGMPEVGSALKGAARRPWRG